MYICGNISVASAAKKHDFSNLAPGAFKTFIHIILAVC